MKKRVPPESAAKRRPLTYYAKVLQQHLKRSGEGKLFGANDRDIASLEKFLGTPIPADLKRWFLLCNGNVSGFSSVRKRKDWSIAAAMGTPWGTKDWIPFADDGCGDNFAISIKPIAGTFPVAFFDVVDFENPAYFVASSLERFLQSFIALNDWHRFESETEPEDEDFDIDAFQWRFDKKAALKVDPGLAVLPKKLLPWNCD